MVRTISTEIGNWLEVAVTWTSSGVAGSPSGRSTVGAPASSRRMPRPCADAVTSSVSNTSVGTSTAR